MDLRITGLEQVQRRLKEAPKTLVLKTYARALDKAAGVIAAEVELRAAALSDSGSATPLAEHVITKTEVDVHGRGAVSVVGFDSTQDERTGIPQDLKALLVEYGHKQTTHAPEKVFVKEIEPHPFFRSAFDASADRAIEVFTEEVISNLSVIEE